MKIAFNSTRKSTERIQEEEELVQTLMKIEGQTTLLKMPSKVQRIGMEYLIFHEKNKSYLW